jgi:hypothetical protein
MNSAPAHKNKTDSPRARQQGARIIKGVIHNLLGRRINLLVGLTLSIATAILNPRSNTRAFRSE